MGCGAAALGRLRSGTEDRLLLRALPLPAAKRLRGRVEEPLRIAPLIWRLSCCGAVSLVTACADGASDEPVAPPDTPPAARIQTLRLSLHEAQRAWSEGRREEAQARVRAAYRDEFEPLEPLLRPLDPVATLRLEYRFGALERQVSRSGDALAVAESVQQITRGADALVAELPPELSPVQEDTPTVGSPKAETTELPAHLRGG